MSSKKVSLIVIGVLTIVLGTILGGVIVDATQSVFKTGERVALVCFGEPTTPTQAADLCAGNTGTGRPSLEAQLTYYAKGGTVPATNLPDSTPTDDTLYKDGGEMIYEIDVFAGARSIGSLIPTIYYASVLVIGIGLIGLSVAGYARRGPLASYD